MPCEDDLAQKLPPRGYQDLHVVSREIVSSAFAVSCAEAVRKHWTTLLGRLVLVVPTSLRLAGAVVVPKRTLVEVGRQTKRNRCTSVRLGYGSGFFSLASKRLLALTRHSGGVLHTVITRFGEVLLIILAAPLKARTINQVRNGRMGPVSTSWTASRSHPNVLLVSDVNPEYP